MKQRTDYYENIVKQEEASAKLKAKIDRETSPEDRKTKKNLNTYNN